MLRTILRHKQVINAVGADVVIIAATPKFYMGGSLPGVEWAGRSLSVLSVSYSFLTSRPMTYLTSHRLDLVNSIGRHSSSPPGPSRWRVKYTNAILRDCNRVNVFYGGDTIIAYEQ